MINAPKNKIFKSNQILSVSFWDLFLLIFAAVLAVVSNAVCVSVFDQVWLLPMLEAAKVSPLIEKVSDHKDFKKLLRTRTNVLVLYTKTGQMRTDTTSPTVYQVYTNNAKKILGPDNTIETFTKEFNEKCNL